MTPARDPKQMFIYIICCAVNCNVVFMCDVWLSIAIWCYLGLSGAIWGYLKLSGAIWCFLVLVWAIWGYRGLSGAIWGCLGLSGALVKDVCRHVYCSWCQRKRFKILNQRRGERFFIVVLTMRFKAILPAGEGFWHTGVLLVVSKGAPQNPPPASSRAFFHRVFKHTF